MAGRRSWSRDKNGSFSAKSYTLKKDGRELAKIQETVGGKWFAYGLSGGCWNTFSEAGGLMTFSEAMAAGLKRSAE